MDFWYRIWSVLFVPLLVILLMIGPSCGTITGGVIGVGLCGLAFLLDWQFTLYVLKNDESIPEDFWNEV